MIYGIVIKRTLCVEAESVEEAKEKAFDGYECFNEVERLINVFPIHKDGDKE